MVDIKRQDITLSDRTKGISADEFAWGSYFYSEWIQSWYSTKWFKLGHFLDTLNLNERTNWYPISVTPCKWSLLTDSSPEVIFVTKDGKVEMTWTLNGSTRWNGDTNGGGAIYSLPYNSPRKYVASIVYGDYLLIFSDSTWAHKINYKDTYQMNWDAILYPRFENNASWWTVGAWWTLTDDGMEHTTWNVGTLETSVNAFDDGAWRFAVKVVGCKHWNVVLSYVEWGNPSWDILTTEEGRDGWFEASVTVVDDSNTYTIIITPSSDFDGIVEAVNFHTYKSYSDITWLTAADKRMAIERGWDIYVSAKNTVDVISTQTWTCTANAKLVRADEEIVWLTVQWDSLIIWATNGLNSHQYYWNGVDSIATEVITWEWQVIHGVTGTETVAYVLAWWWGTSAWNAYRLYAVSWYQRSLIASNAYKTENDQRNLNRYHPSKKFVFNDVEGSNSMTMYLDNLYLPWCDGIYQYGQTIPGLSKSWSRPINYENWAKHISLYQNISQLGFCYYNNQRSYYSTVYNDSYCDYWYLVTDSLYWDKLGTRKALEKIKLWYKNLAKDYGQINIYAIVDDDYFRRFDVSWITNRPKVWDTYEVAEETVAEIISIDKTNSTSWVIAFRTVENLWSLSKAKQYLTKVTWNGDASIDTNNNYDNLVFLKSIQSDNQEYGSDFVFWKDFVDNYIPFWHKIQFVIEITKTNESYQRKRSPEIYELSFVSDITDTVL